MGQDAGSLGAAAIAAVGVGLWKDLSKVKEIHQLKKRITPDPEAMKRYEAMMPVFEQIADMQSEIGDLLEKLKM